MTSLTDYIRLSWDAIDEKAPRKANFSKPYDRYYHDRERCRICLQGRDHLRFTGRKDNVRYWRGSFAKVHNAALEMGGRGMEVYYRQIGTSLYWLLTLVEPPQKPPDWWEATV